MTANRKDHLDEAVEMIGGRVYKVTIPVTRIIEWVKKYKKQKSKKIEYEWKYDGCGCMPPEGARSDPYCHEHYNPLIRVEHEI